MDVRTSGGDDFKRLAAKFRETGKNGAAVRKALTKVVQGHLQRITTKQKARAQGMNVKGVKGFGSVRRQQFHEAKRLRGKNVRDRKGGYGLREAVANAVKSKVNYTGRRLGARVLVDPSAMPPSQRNLPKHLDSPKVWRHPVFGNRAKWVAQRGEPYFTEPIEQERAEVARDVKTAIDSVLRNLK